MTAAGNQVWERGGDDVVAAEYVLGVLPAEERRAAAVRIEAEPEFGRLVDRWQVRLAPMASGYAEVEPPAWVKQALEERMFKAAPAVTRTSGLWQGVAFWRGFSTAALAAVALYVAVPFIAPPTDDAQPTRLVAALAPQGSDVHYVAIYDSTTQDVSLSRVSGVRPRGRDFELWVIQGENPPESLGVIPEGETAFLELTEETRAKLDRGAVLAVSLEPQGGSPTGQPTGPVVAAGDLRVI